jgi:hypothetical protein
LLQCATVDVDPMIMDRDQDEQAVARLYYFTQICH